MKKVAIIGVGGRTGTMFAFELKKSAEILGVGKEKEVEMINQKKVYIDRDGRLESFEGKVIKDSEFKEDFQPDFILLATKNPVGPPIKFYYQSFGHSSGSMLSSSKHQKFKNKEKVPGLLIPQNGFSPLEDTKKTLKEIFEQNVEKIKIVRIVLFNPVQKKEINDKILINYSLPIKIALSKATGSGNVEDLIEIFKMANFEIEVLPKKEAKNLEFSKLFLNLIGMASASRDFPVKEGFSNSDILKEEIEALKEYIKIVKAAGGKFLNFSYYPVKFWAILLNLLPLNLLLILQPLFTYIVGKKRKEKPKDLEEIDFYNGAVVKLGKKLGVKTPVNEKIYKRVIEKLNK